MEGGKTKEQTKELTAAEKLQQTLDTMARSLDGITKMLKKQEEDKKVLLADICTVTRQMIENDMYLSDSVRMITTKLIRMYDYNPFTPTSYGVDNPVETKESIFKGTYIADYKKHFGEDYGK